jgi:hypothetical protein
LKAVGVQAYSNSQHEINSGGLGMRMNNGALPVCLITLLLTSACTTEAWYEGTRRGAENECRRQPPTAAEECLSRINKQTYREYQQERLGGK